MSEYYNPLRQKELSAESPQPNIDSAEKERLIDTYNDLNATRENCEDDGRFVGNFLKEALTLKPKSRRTPEELAQVEKYEAYFKLDEKTLASLEVHMFDVEQAAGLDVDNSRRFDNDKNDVLINSSVFYRDRIDSLRKASGNDEVEKYFVNSVVSYVRAVEYSTMASFDGSYSDLGGWQSSKMSSDRDRSIKHNNMINEFNALNDRCRKYNVEPLTYRNFATSSALNNYKNSRQMYHDRISLVRYIDDVIHSGCDVGVIDPLPE